MNMDMEDRKQTVVEVAEFCGSGYYEACIEKSRSMQKIETDPLLCGWYFFYEYQSLFMLKRYKEAYNLFNSISSSDSGVLVFTGNNGIWIYSVAMELAYRLKDKIGLNWIGKKAMELARNDLERSNQIADNWQQMCENL